jgi:hypothetical protein
MLVFVSSSGQKSHSAAVAIREWLCKVIQAIEPWLSDEIEKGSRWGTEIQERLEKSRVGIFCLTPENLNAPWILFEAGAISKNPDSLVCTFLLGGLRPADVAPPLGLFEHTLHDKEEFRKLIGSINGQLGRNGDSGRPLEEKILNDVFEQWWPSLENDLQEIESKEPGPRQLRTDRELLEEVLERLRGGGNTASAYITLLAENHLFMTNVMSTLAVLEAHVRGLREPDTLFGADKIRMSTRPSD